MATQTFANFVLAVQWCCQDLLQQASGAQGGRYSTKSDTLHFSMIFLGQYGMTYAHPCWCTSIWPSSTKPARLILKAAESKESAGWKKWVGPSRLRWRFVVSEVLRSNWNGNLANLAHGRKNHQYNAALLGFHWSFCLLLPLRASPWNTATQKAVSGTLERDSLSAQNRNLLQLKS